jgi:hypothetical protein
MNRFFLLDRQLAESNRYLHQASISLSNIIDSERSYGCKTVAAASEKKPRDSDSITVSTTTSTPHLSVIVALYHGEQNKMLLQPCGYLRSLSSYRDTEAHHAIFFFIQDSPVDIEDNITKKSC